jgi:TonB family protein
MFSLMSRAPRSPDRERDYVLVVDSDLANLNATLAALSARGFEAAPARSVDEIREIAVSRGRPLVAIIEPAAEGVDGFRLCRSMVTAYGEERPLLLLASNRLHGRVAESRARDSGAFLFVERPARDQTLFDAVAHAFARAGGECRAPGGQADPRRGKRVVRARRERDRVRVSDPGAATAAESTAGPVPVAVETSSRTAREIDLTEASVEEFENWLDDAFASFDGLSSQAERIRTSDEAPREAAEAVMTKPAAVALAPVIDRRERGVPQAPSKDQGGGEGPLVGAVAPESAATPPGSTRTRERSAGRAAATALSEPLRPRAEGTRGRILWLSAVATLLVIAGVTVGAARLWPRSPGSKGGLESAGPTVPALREETSEAQAAGRPGTAAAQDIGRTVPAETADAAVDSASAERAVREVSAGRQPPGTSGSRSGGTAPTPPLARPIASKSGHAGAAVREVEAGRHSPGEAAAAPALASPADAREADAVSNRAQPAAGGSEEPSMPSPSEKQVASTEDGKTASETDSGGARAPRPATADPRDESTLANPSGDPAAERPTAASLAATASTAGSGPAAAAKELAPEAPTAGPAAADLEPTAASAGAPNSGSGLVAEVTGTGSRESSDAEPVVVPPELIRSTRVEPAYPLAARQLRASGEVTLSVLVGTDGTVDRIEVLEEPSSALGFGAAAKRAVSQWRFRPGLRDGRPVPHTTTVKFFFNP